MTPNLADPAARARLREAASQASLSVYAGNYTRRLEADRAFERACPKGRPALLALAALDLIGQQQETIARQQAEIDELEAKVTHLRSARAAKRENER